MNEKKIFFLFSVLNQSHLRIIIHVCTIFIVIPINHLEIKSSKQNQPENEQLFAVYFASNHPV